MPSYWEQSQFKNKNKKPAPGTGVSGGGLPAPATAPPLKYGDFGYQVPGISGNAWVPGVTATGAPPTPYVPPDTKPEGEGGGPEDPGETKTTPDAEGGSAFTPATLLSPFSVYGKGFSFGAAPAVGVRSTGLLRALENARVQRIRQLLASRGFDAFV